MRNRLRFGLERRELKTTLGTDTGTDEAGLPDKDEVIWELTGC